MKQKNAQLDALVDSKKEYIEHLFDLLTEPMVATFQDIYQQCLAAPETRKKGILASFQDALVGIASWNHHLIHEQYVKVVAHSGCKYIPDLVRALISVQVKINLMANSQDPMSHNIKLRIPSADNFVHRCYVDVARAVWKRPYLLYHNVRAVEKQQNLLDLEKIVQQAIRTVLRGYVPMEQLIAQIQLDARGVESVPVSASEFESETESETSVSEIASESASEVEYESETDAESETESEIEPEFVTVVHEPTPEPEPVPAPEPEPQQEAEREEPTFMVQDEDTEILQTVYEVDEPHVESAQSSEEEEVQKIDITETEEDTKKSVEVKSYEEVENNSPAELKVAKVDGTSPVSAPMPPQEVAEKATPFHMMLLNRKIVRPPSVIMKKKKKDAFF